jgi:hypothetical protein
MASPPAANGQQTQSSECGGKKDGRRPQRPDLNGAEGAGNILGVLSICKIDVFKPKPIG